MARAKRNPPVNLDSIPTPQQAGRLDCLAYNLGMRFIQNQEASSGLSGLADAVKSDFHNIVVNAIGGVVIPPEMNLLVRMAHAHMVSQEKKHLSQDQDQYQDQNLEGNNNANSRK